MNSRYEWKPGVGVGPYHFGAPIQKFIESGQLQHFPIHDVFGEMHSYDDEAAGIVVFPKDDDDGNIIVQSGHDNEAGIIDSVTCHNSILYRGRELLGLSLNELVAILNYAPDIDGEEIHYDDGDIQTTADFDELGLIMWFRDGISVSASVMEIVVGDADE